MSSAQDRSKYRPDIDGLRAIAVLSVIAFHFFPTRARAGFIGVDVFFVISGYLISTIILEGLDRQSFSFLEFYSRRIRRIFPALIVVLGTALVFGWFTLFAEEYRQLCKQIAAGVGFVSNLSFWSESGYFDAAAETKPMLHLWSLGIEEQFYIVWPLFIWTMVKRSWSVFPVICILAVTSFVYGIAQLQTDPAGAFYSPLSRGWELCVGSALAYISLRSSAGGERNSTAANAQSVIGAAMLATGLLLITREHAFPGTWALLPTIGTALLISAGENAWLNRYVLARRWLVAVGLISYPLYLWHWPILIFARLLFAGEMQNRWFRLALLPLAFALAWITYVLIEKRVRHGARRQAKTMAVAVVLLLIGCIGYAGYSANGFEGTGIRNAARGEFLDYFDNSRPEWRYFKRTNFDVLYRNDCNFYDLERDRVSRFTDAPRSRIDASCYTRNPGIPHAVFIWGDSHAQQLYPGLKKVLSAEWQILQVATSKCPPDADVTGPSTANFCVQSNYTALQAIRSARPEVVVVGQYTAHSVTRMHDIARRLKALGVARVVFTGPTPHWAAPLPTIAVRRLWPDIPRRTLVGLRDDVFSGNARLKQQFENSSSEQFVSVVDVLCNADGCMTYLGADRITGLTSFDDGHLTPISSEFVARRQLAQAIISAVGRQDAKP